MVELSKSTAEKELIFLIRSKRLEKYIDNFRHKYIDESRNFDPKEKKNLVLENSLVNLDRNKERRASDGLSNARI